MHRSSLVQYLLVLGFCLSVLKYPQRLQFSLSYSSQPQRERKDKDIALIYTKLVVTVTFFSDKHFQDILLFWSWRTVDEVMLDGAPKTKLLWSSGAPPLIQHHFSLPPSNPYILLKLYKLYQKVGNTRTVIKLSCRI